MLSDNKKIPDCYISRKDASSLLSGDKVEYSVQRSGRKTSAIIHAILERRQKRVVGQVFAEGRQVTLHCSDGSIYSIKNASSKHNHQWVEGEIVTYPTHRALGVVSIARTLGPSLLPCHDVTIAISQFFLNSQFSQETLGETEHLRAEAVPEARSRHRRDLRSHPFVTIDGEDAKDFDDAIWVEATPSGYTLYVAIADVSFFVRPSTSLDTEALDRGTSVYFPGECIPMLPEALSNDLCSLRPREERLALVCEIPFDRGGQPDKGSLYTAVIKTEARLTYRQVHEFIRNKKEQGPITQKLVGPLETAYALYKALRKQREKRGVLDFQLSESFIQLDAEGWPTSVTPAAHFESHQLIEEFMVSANREVARQLRQYKVPALYRIHETPDPEKIEELNQTMRSLGISRKLTQVSSKSFSELLHSIADQKGSHTLHQLVLRAQKQARYDTEPLGHFGLALSDYTHFTSPIRRYPDLVVHRRVKHLINRAKNDDKWVSSLPSIASQTSECERRAMEAERFVTRRKKCWFMQEHVGEAFEGTISGVIAEGVFVEIEKFAVEGFVPLDALLGFYYFDEARRALRKRPGHSMLSLGDAMLVQVGKVSVEEGRITLLQVENKP